MAIDFVRKWFAAVNATSFLFSRKGKVTRIITPLFFLSGCFCAMLFT